ncbi:PREDICTED: peptidyl-prolyl cis-trans isomerase FKBP53-like [Camelina sativa]|uniref:Peptidyl-prolyl cis-trans isomerase FKBP53-like n=1 Tax=Camelina sativa TaxID=90675 RepID=A0ABM1QUR6_CAMSA|nr:PREDICTED: peptidyl-prolyl cis-trans isomerase FKBP53-like [Camelina sativa]
MYGKNMADKASELNGFYMGERKLAVRLLSVPRIRPVHSLPLRKGPPPALLDAHHSASAAAIPQSRSESSKTLDKPAEKKKRSSEEHSTLETKAVPSSVDKQTADRDGLFVDDLRMGDPNGKKDCPFRS